MGKLCVSELYVGSLEEGGGRRRMKERRTEVHNQKQEPHTMMWGKTVLLDWAFFIIFILFDMHHTMVHHMLEG